MHAFEKLVLAWFSGGVLHQFLCRARVPLVEKRMRTWERPERVGARRTKSSDRSCPTNHSGLCLTELFFGHLALTVSWQALFRGFKYSAGGHTST